MKNKTKRESITAEELLLLKESVKCIMDTDYPIKIITKKNNGRTNNKRKSK